MAETRLSIEDFSVSYGDRLTVSGLRFDVEPGEIIGLLGANGSGKSTTVKALTGVHPPNNGSRLVVNGNALRARELTPAAARRNGIRVVHQESPLIGTSTVAEAIAMHVGFPKRCGLVRRREMESRAATLLGEFGIGIDPGRFCADLTTGERALVSFVIALSGIEPNRALLILDEATAALPTTDAERYLLRVRETVARGLSVIMVTHRLSEVRDHCDRSVVLRGGEKVAEFDAASFSEHGVVHAMMGEGDISAPQIAREKRADATDSDLVVEAIRGPGVCGISLTAAAGTVVGLAGRPGGGAGEILRILAGVAPRTAGSVRVGRNEVRGGHPRNCIAHGIFYVSSDRLAEGGVSALSVAENLILPKVERFGLCRERRRKLVSSMISRLGVQPTDPDAVFGSLSGGNQQKVLLGRWLPLTPKVLLLDDPTAGVDPHAREVIFAEVEELRAAGTTVLLRSSEPAQLARLCDRVLMFRDGHLISELTSDTITTEEVSVAAYA